MGLSTWLLIWQIWNKCLQFPLPMVPSSIFRAKVFVDASRKLCLLLPIQGLIWRFAYFPFPTYLEPQFYLYGVESNKYNMTWLYPLHVCINFNGICIFDVSGLKTHESFIKGSFLCAPQNRFAPCMLDIKALERQRYLNYYNSLSDWIWFHLLSAYFKRTYCSFCQAGFVFPLIPRTVRNLIHLLFQSFPRWIILEEFAFSTFKI